MVYPGGDLPNFKNCIRDNCYKSKPSPTYARCISFHSRLCHRWSPSHVASSSCFLQIVIENRLSVGQTCIQQSTQESTRMVFAKIGPHFGLHKIVRSQIYLLGDRHSREACSQSVPLLRCDYTIGTLPSRLWFPPDVSIDLYFIDDKVSRDA